MARVVVGFACVFDDEEDHVRRPLLRSGQVAAVALVAAGSLAVAGAPAAAAPAAAKAARSAGAASVPAPLDPGRASPRAGARITAAPARKVPNQLLKEVLAENDNEGTDQPNLSALCQQYIGKPNPYANPAPNVDQITGDAIVSTGTQTGCSTAQNETTIAVNPYNPKNLVAGTNDYRVFNTREQRNDGSGWAYTSFDGGRTWADVQLPHLTFQTGATGALSYMDSAGDPAVAFGPHNTVYYANLVFSRATHPAGQQSASGLAVSISHDGGRTWADPKIVQLDGVTPAGTYTPTTFFNDKEWISADPVSGAVYVTWTRFTYDATGAFQEAPITAVASGDFGGTWSAPHRVAPDSVGFTGGITPFDQGSSPQVGRDGTLYIAYEASVCATLACNGPDDHDAVVLATSRDHGRTYTNQEIDVNFDFPTNEDVGRATLTGENFRINSFPLTAYDPITDQLWITWADDRNGQYDSNGQSVKTNGDVFVTSFRRGHGHGATLKVGSAADEVFPAVAVFAGRVAVSYYTRAYDPSGIGLDYAYSTGWGTSINGAPLRRITTQTENPQVQFVGAGAVTGKELQGVFIGDYTALAMGADFVIHPCWTDFRGRPGVTAPNQDAYSQAIWSLF
jgi:hypothetical protein